MFSLFLSPVSLEMINIATRNYVQSKVDFNIEDDFNFFSPLENSCRISAIGVRRVFCNIRLAEKYSRYVTGALLLAQSLPLLRDTYSCFLIFSKEQVLNAPFTARA